MPITRTFTTRITTELTYDPDSEDFKAAYASYIGSIYSGGTINDMLIAVAAEVASHGERVYVEGVGEVAPAHNPVFHDKHPSGILAEVLDEETE